MVIPPCENHDDKMMIWICEWWDFDDKEDWAKYLGWWLLPQLRSFSPNAPVYSASLILSRWRDILPGSNEKREFAAIQVVLPKRTIELSEAETAGHLNQAIEENRSNQAEEEWDPIQPRKIFIRREIWNWSLEEKTISWCHQPDSKWISRPGDQGEKLFFWLTRSWLAAGLWGFALRLISGFTFYRIWLDLNEQLSNKHAQQYKGRIYGEKVLFVFQMWCFFGKRVLLLFVLQMYCFCCCCKCGVISVVFFWQNMVFFF